MKNLKFLFLFAAVVLLLTGCADVIQLPMLGDPYGFWSGLWHGFIAPISFIGSLIYDDIAVYAVNNTGGWYDFGFLIGIGGFSAGSASATKR